MECFPSVGVKNKQRTKFHDEIGEMQKHIKFWEFEIRFAEHGAVAAVEGRLDMPE